MSDYCNVWNTGKLKSFELYFSIKHLFLATKHLPKWRRRFVKNSWSLFVKKLTILSCLDCLIMFKFLLACGTYTYQGIYKMTFQTSDVSINTGNMKYPIEHQLFTLNFAFKLIHVSIAIDNCRSPKYYLWFLNNYVYHKLNKIEWARTIQYLELYDKKPFTMLTISDISLAPFFKEVFCKWNN